MKTAVSLFVGMTWLKSGVAASLIAVLLFFPVRGVRAQTIWIDGADDWFNPPNWSAGVPNSSTDAEINNGGEAQIVSAGATAANFYLGFESHDAGSLLVSGSGTLRDISFWQPAIPAPAW